MSNLTTRKPVFDLPEGRSTARNELVEELAIALEGMTASLAIAALRAEDRQS